MDDVIKERDIGKGFEDTFVGDHGGVHFVFELVEDDTGAGEAFGFDSGEGEEDVVEGTEAVSRDEDDWEGEVFG